MPVCWSLAAFILGGRALCERTIDGAFIVGTLAFIDQDTTKLCTGSTAGFTSKPLAAAIVDRPPMVIVVVVGLVVVLYLSLDVLMFFSAKKMRWKEETWSKCV
jgi:hypothetical protein